MGVEIRRHTPGSDPRAFLRAGHEILGDDPAWIPPLDFELRDRLNPAKNPFFEHADAMLFTAWRGGRLVGRCSASVDRQWLTTWDDDTGHFGFFDTVDDPAVARALLEAAEGWLRERGMKRVNGPMSLGANEEIGLLVDGFEHPPVLMMPHSRPHQGALVEACGYAKEKDLWCWHFPRERKLRRRIVEAWEQVNALEEVTLRTVDMKRFDEELAVLVEIYNEAWAGKWGFVPITGAEVRKMAKDLELVIDPEIAFVADIDGEPVGMCVMVPNLNEAIADLRGRLFPLGWAKLLWRVKVKRPRSARLILLGIREKVRRNVKRYGGLSAAMYAEVSNRGVARGYEWSELSWTREDDAPINVGIRAMGGRVYRTYRVYHKPL